ncbi:unnamed protein product [Rotaria sp. Silwood1]|nr:unnamed protein product [Rotaria sp. Silwood1]CAF1650609.1 unnamed protein product [Rotaria sp. Silwood1]CAF3809165.1 unnamed protein product [Rotaria sp. Silwood1]CAF3823475.1 unnamed protein product [Rotaria sp. Silwood1]CAF4800827.1 unnamed protein product [Rotaria sp. Silwood1]
MSTEDVQKMDDIPSSSDNKHFPARPTTQEIHQENLLLNDQVLQTSHKNQELIMFLEEQNTNKIDREQQTIRINQHDSYTQTDLVAITTGQEQINLLNDYHILSIFKHQNKLIVNFNPQQSTNKQIDHDQAQQTIEVNQHEAQTDLITTTTTVSSQQKNMKSNLDVNGVNSTPTSKVLSATNPSDKTVNFLGPFETIAPSLQQVINCSKTTNSVITSAIKKMTSIRKTKSHRSRSLEFATRPTSHNIVDLTEKDDDTTNKAYTEKMTSIKSKQSSISTLSSTVTSIRMFLLILNISDNVLTLVEPTNRSICPNTTIPLGETIILPPLLEHNPCDNSITRPQLLIKHKDTMIQLIWNLPSTSMESIEEYEIYTYQQSLTTVLSGWEKLKTVKSKHRPMRAAIKYFQYNCHYAFAIRAISINNGVGRFSKPKTIFIGSIYTY